LNKVQNNYKGGIFLMRKIFSFLGKRPFSVGTTLLLVIMYFPFFPLVRDFIFNHWLFLVTLYLITFAFFTAGAIKLDPDKKREDLISSLIFVIGFLIYIALTK